MQKIVYLILFLSFFHLHDVEGLDSKLFSERLQEPTPTWMVEQIEHDLKPFQNELSKKFLDEFFEEMKEGWYLVRIRVHDNQLAVESSNTAKDYGLAHYIISALDKLHQQVPFPDIDFIFTSHDIIGGHAFALRRGDAVPSVPVFCIAKHKKDPGMILMPDWYALREFYPDKDAILQGSEKYPWEFKFPLLFFRGGDSGAFDRVHWRDFGRVKLVSLSLQRPDLIDAKFTYLMKHEEDSRIRDMMVNEGMMGQHMPLKEFPRYRYLVDVDGHTANTPRVALLLHSNSVMFKQMTSDMLWFYPTLIPYTHFIPIKEDLSDLYSQIEWAKKHDDACRKVSENANQLAADVLTPESIYLYLYRLLEAYSKKQSGVYLCH